MCGRARQVLDWQDMKVKWWSGQPILNLRARWNAAPRQDMLMLRAGPGDEPGTVEGVTMNWGFVPYWEKDPKGGRRPINAMTESVAKGGMWRDSFKRRRCIFPVNGFYEWQKADGGKIPYAIDRADGGIMALASLWDRWKNPETGDELTSFAVITCPPNDLVAPIHNRMPVVLDAADYDAWLSGTGDQATALLKPCPADELTAYRVGDRVGNVRNDDEAVLARPVL
jgi:putative SOS response-associated peptidase YedK